MLVYVMLRDQMQPGNADAVPGQLYSFRGILMQTASKKFQKTSGH